ncbi:MAG: porin family protein [Pseudomonadales bacterium]|nr:porin family protein [Pseudomonadales bacterium]
MILRINLLLDIMEKFIFTTSANAQNYHYQQDRTGSWETSLMWRYQGAETIKGNYGSKIEFDSASRGGFTFGYNFDKKWNLQWEYSHVKPSYKATYVKDDQSVAKNIDHTAGTTTNNFNLTYHFLEGKITPFVMAGLGWTKTDSNIASGASPGCWWTWYGRVCNRYTTSYKSTDFSYNAGMGLRWELDDRMFLRGSYGFQWVDMDNVGSTPRFEVGRFEFGYRI